MLGRSFAHSNEFSEEMNAFTLKCKGKRKISKASKHQNKKKGVK